MKKLLLITILFLISFVTAVNGQSWTEYVTTIDSGETTTEAFSIKENYWLKSAWFPAMVSGTDSVFLLVSMDNVTYDTLRYDNEHYMITIEDGHSSPVSFPANVTAGWQWYKYFFTDEQDTTYSIKSIGIKNN